MTHLRNKNRTLPEKLVVSGRVEPTGEMSNIFDGFERITQSFSKEPKDL